MNHSPNNLIARVPLIALPRTGQVTSDRSGDDGYFQAGSPVANRFVDTGIGTVLDLTTALEWVKQPEIIIPGQVGQVLSAEGAWDAGHGQYDFGDLVGPYDAGAGLQYFVCILTHESDVGKPPGNATYWVVTPWTASAANLTTPATMTWNNAIDNCLALVYAGRTDWRLPNIMELLSILAVPLGSSALPYIDQTAFPNTQKNYYWTSTKAGGYTLYCKVTFGAYVGFTGGGGAADLCRVRPVRGGYVNANP